FAFARQPLDVALELSAFLDLKTPIAHGAAYASGASDEKLLLHRQRAPTQARDVGRRRNSVAFKAPAFQNGDMATRFDLALEGTGDHQTIATHDLAAKADAGRDEQAPHWLVHGFGDGCFFRH